MRWWWSGVALALAGSLAASCELRTLPDGANTGAGGSGAGGASVDPDGYGGRMEPPPSGTGGAGGGIIVSPPPLPGVGGATGGPASCSDLEARYVAAVQQDGACDPTLNVPQCQRIEIPSLCGGCSVHVNTTAAATAVRLEWDRVPCPLPPACGPFCPASAGGATCVPDGTGGGRCVENLP